jgi:methionyl-tRNA formyltransferase
VPAYSPREPLSVLCLMQLQEAEFFQKLMSRHGEVACLHIESIEHLIEVTSEPHRCRLIAFSTDIIVPKAVLERLPGDCFNFHLGPPERPGFRPASFAAFEHATSFGVTFHGMTERVDAGPIYRVSRFDLLGTETESEVAIETYKTALALASELAPTLADPRAIFIPSGDKWGRSRTTRRQYETIKMSK